MVLNHASLSSPDRVTAIHWLRDIAVGMSVLIREGVAGPVLRSSLSPYEIFCFDTWTLGDAYQELRRQGGRDEYVFLLRLVTKSPLLEQVASDLEDRFLRCEDRTLVESHLARLNTGDLGTIFNRLASLDATAANWRKLEDDVPPWRTKVTNETASVRDNSVLRQSRRVRSSDGSRQLYLWHARYGGSGRIHIRFVRSTYLIEIGYIGPHLPL